MIFELIKQSALRSKANLAKISTCGLAEAGFALRRWRRHGQLHALVAGEITQLGAEGVHVVAEVAELCLYGAR